MWAELQAGVDLCGREEAEGVGAVGVIGWWCFEQEESEESERERLIDIATKRHEKTRRGMWRMSCRAA